MYVTAAQDHRGLIWREGGVGMEKVAGTGRVVVVVVVVMVVVCSSSGTV
jgi:hypothetical protein